MDWIFQQNSIISITYEPYSSNYLEVQNADGTLTVSEIPYDSDMAVQCGVSS